MRARVRYQLAPGESSVELMVAEYQDQRFRPHWHRGFAIGVVTGNTQGFRCNGIDWIAGPGDLILINPGQVHDGYSVGTGWSTRMAYIPEATMKVLLGVSESCEQRFDAPVVHRPALHVHFLRWHHEAEGCEDLTQHSLTREVFSELRSITQRRDRLAPLDSWQGDQTTCLIDRLRVLAEVGHLSVSDLQADLACSRTTSWRRTKRELGLAPKPLLSQLRLIAAKEMLARGVPLIEVALECGYHDQSHFSREFAAAYGMTAGQFRRVQSGR